MKIKWRRKTEGKKMRKRKEEKRRKGRESS